MPIFAVANTKGGVSKTTTTLNLAVAATLDGKRVLMVDADPGQSLRKASGTRDERGDADKARTPDDPKYRADLPFIESITLFGRDIDRQLKAKAGDYDLILVDVGGEGQGALEVRKTLLVANRVIVPCRPTPADTTRLEAMHDMVSEAKGINEALTAHLFPVQANPNARSSDVIDFYKAAAKYFEFDMLSTIIRAREAYKSWAWDGEGVLEKPKNAANRPAQEEVRQLYAEALA